MFSIQKIYKFYAILFVTACCEFTVFAPDYKFPADADIVNVKDFGAKGDGLNDDTESIRQAIMKGIEKVSRYSAPCFVYFPEGNYLLTDYIASKIDYDPNTSKWSGGWRAGMILVGENRDKTIIRLKDSCPGYQDPSKPKYLIATGSESDYHKPCDGGGNRAFRHSIINLTVDTGKDNPGAIAVDYVANNRGCIEDVSIRSGDGKGVIGLNLSRHWPGPALCKRISIEGFDYGIKVAGHYQYSMTFEHIELKNQNICAILNDNNVLAIRDLKSFNKVPVYVNNKEHALIALVDAVLEGGSNEQIAFDVKGKIYLRNIVSSGYGIVVKDRTKQNLSVTPPENETKFVIDEYKNEAVSSLFPSPDKALMLPIKETPEYHTNDHSKWVNIKSFAAPPLEKEGENVTITDWSEAIQSAIDNGKDIVYLPNGDYRTSKPIIIRGNIRKIMGFQSSVGYPKENIKDPVFIFEGKNDCILEHLRIAGKIIHNSPTSALSVRHCDFEGYENTANGKGNIFFEDTIGKPIIVKYPQNLWARQLNCEFGELPLVENHGGTMWIFGYKTEGEMTCLLNDKGSAEILGSMPYPLRNATKHPCWVNNEGRISLVFRLNGKDYSICIEETRNGQTKRIGIKDRPWSVRGPALYNGYSK